MLSEDVSVLHYNARPHTSQQIFTRLQHLGWSVVTHPPYIWDLTHSDYHLFSKLKQICLKSAPTATTEAECNDVKNVENCRVSLITIEYSFRQFQLKRHIYQPKYNSIELFSYIGGYMGLWLGISLIPIFDLSESIFKVLHFSLKKKTSRRVKRQNK
nr:uncharacterized protein LOC107442491 [Parasteatoda tepidariorum]